MLGLGASAACGFGHLLGVWERVPADQGRRVCIYDTGTRSPRDVSGFETAALSAPPFSGEWFCLRVALLPPAAWGGASMTALGPVPREGATRSPLRSGCPPCRACCEDRPALRARRR